MDPLSPTPEANRRPDPGKPFGRAVVLGGSIAGLLSARVLADHFAQVVVVERDDLDGDLTGSRRGVSQSRHTHGLLVGGLRAIERLLPGFTETLVTRGATHGDILAGISWHIGGGTLARVPSGLYDVLGSRALIESQVRRMVREVPGVQLLGGHDVAALVGSADRARVVGVRVVDRYPASTASVLDADLVVDATGRGSRTPGWLTDLGYPAPVEELVKIDISYSTRLFRRVPGQLGGLDGEVLAATPPQRRSGVALSIEGHCWIVTLAGCLGDRPPSDLADFTAFARTLDQPGIAELISTAEPIGGAETIRYPASRWLRYDRCARLPDGLIAIGDAVGSFNPVFGQGMSSAALQVEALGRVLARRAARAAQAARAGRPPHPDAALEGLPREAAKKLAAVVSVPWTLAVGTDRRYPGMPRKPLPERFLDRYLDRLLAVARSDERVAVAFITVLNLLARPESLLRPAVAYRVLRPGAVRTAPPVDDDVVGPLGRPDTAQVAHRPRP